MKIITKSKSEQIACIIRDHVEHNLIEGSKLPPEAEWAKQLNVNKSTLCKALLQLQREGYVSRKAGVGTIVTFNGQHAVKNIVTAVLFPDLNFTHDTYYSIIIRELSKQTLMADHMHSVVNIGNENRQSINRPRLEQLLRQPHLAGVIVAAGRLDDEETIAALVQTQNIPLVLIGAYAENPAVNFVCADQYQATIELIAHAENAGYRNMAFVSKTLNTWSRKERHRAFVEKKGKAGIYIGTGRENAFQAGCQAMQHMLANGLHPECILAADKGTADGIRQAVQEQTCAPSIPLLTFDYYFEDDRRDILASAVQPLEAMAQKAVDYIVKQDYSKPLQVMLKNRILIEAGHESSRTNR